MPACKSWRALDVDISDLVGKRHGIPSGNPDAGIVAIRRALTPVDDLLGEIPEEHAVTHNEGSRAVDYAWGAYWAGRYELLSSILPSGLVQLRATVHAARNGMVAPANELLARMYWVTGCTLVHLGQTDPAFLAIRQALVAAEQGNDPLLLATIRGSVAWQLLVQGRYDESRRSRCVRPRTSSPRVRKPRRTCRPTVPWYCRARPRRGERRMCPRHAR